MPQLTLLEWTKDGSLQQLRLIAKVAKKWRKLGSAGLGMEEYELDNLEVRLDDLSSCRNLFNKFLENGSPNYETPTWGNLILALKKAELGQVATTLQNALHYIYI